MGDVGGRIAGTVDRRGIDQPPLRDVCGPVGRNRAKEATLVALVASRADLPHPQQDRVAITIDADFHHALAVTAGLALAPQSAPAATKVRGEPFAQRFPKRLLVHPCEHQDPTARRVLGDRGQQPLPTERKVRQRWRGGVVGVRWGSHGEDRIVSRRVVVGWPVGHSRG